jgi:hypothetical protein
MAPKPVVRTNEVTRQLIGKHLGDACAGRPHREVWCIYYDECLDKAVAENVATWSCKACGRVVTRKALAFTAPSWSSCLSSDSSVVACHLLD